MESTGELIALGTALCWTITVLSFEYAGKKIGSLSLNIIRLVAALLLFFIYGLIVRGNPFPVQAGAERWLWLGLSGFVGFVLGDLLLFQAFVEIGARISMLVYASVPGLTALMGWLVLGEVMSPAEIGGMVIVVTGIALVVLGKDTDGKGHPVRGVLLAFGGALGQAGGLVLAKLGSAGYDPFMGTQIRSIAGIAGFAVIFFITRRWKYVFGAFRQPKAIGIMWIGAFFGPFLGVSLGLMAVSYTTTGIVSTITGLVPVLIIPPSILLFKEKIHLREAVGAILAVSGTALLFLV